MSAPARHPLAALEELRRRHVEEARAELAGAAAEAERARRRWEEARRELYAASERRGVAERLVRGATAAEWERHARWVARLRGDERALAAEVGALWEEAVRAAAQEERRRGALVDAERELRTVELRRERWEAELRRADRLAEEAEQDDLVTARAARRP